jgi:hypothetical protein
MYTIQINAPITPAIFCPPSFLVIERTTAYVYGICLGDSHA